LGKRRKNLKDNGNWQTVRRARATPNRGGALPPARADGRPHDLAAPWDAR